MNKAKAKRTPRTINLEDVNRTSHMSLFSDELDRIIGRGTVELFITDGRFDPYPGTVSDAKVTFPIDPETTDALRKMSSDVRAPVYMNERQFLDADIFALHRPRRPKITMLMLLHALGLADLFVLPPMDCRFIAAASGACSYPAAPIVLDKDDEHVDTRLATHINEALAWAGLKKVKAPHGGFTFTKDLDTVDSDAFVAAIAAAAFAEHQRCYRRA